MRLFKRIIGFFAAILLWLWALLPKGIDLVGRTTLPDDWRQLMDEKLPVAFQWLFSTPYWVPAVLALALTIWIMWPSKSWNASRPTTSDDRPEDPSSSPEEHRPREAEELVSFVNEHLLPTCWAQQTLQECLIENLDLEAEVKSILGNGLMSGDLRHSIDTLTRTIAHSPSFDLPARDIEAHVKSIEEGYPDFCNQVFAFQGQTGGVGPVDEDVRAAWKAWAHAHNSLIDEYNKLKRQARFGGLYRPQYQSWFAPKVEIVGDEDELTFLVPAKLGERQRF
jgi:hypothetical protein